MQNERIGQPVYTDTFAKMDCTVYSSPVVVVKQAPNLLNTLSKLHTKDKNHAQILRCYMEVPSIIKGKTFIANNSDKKGEKVKSYNSYSHSQSSKVNSVNVSASTDSSRILHSKRNSDLKLSLKDEQPIANSIDSWRSRIGRTRNGGNFKCRTESNYRYLNSENMSNLSKGTLMFREYSNDYFDLLDLPGHFNTRGVYGQKADVSPFTLKRTNSEISLSNFHSRFGPLERQNTDLKLKIRSTEKTDYFLKESRNAQLLNRNNNKNSNVQIKPARGQSLQQFIDNRKLKRLGKNILPGTTQKIDDSKQGIIANMKNKERDNKIVNVNLMVDEMFDGVGALKVNEQFKYTKPKRNSVDASVQTDGEFTDAASEYFLS